MTTYIVINFVFNVKHYYKKKKKKKKMDVNTCKYLNTDYQSDGIDHQDREETVKSRK